MNLHFDHPWVLALLGLVPLLWALYAVISRQGIRRLEAFMSPGIQRRPGAGPAQARYRGQVALLLPALCLLLLAPLAPAASDQSDLDDMRLLRMPDIHGGTVVFVYAGDLWTADVEGGGARARPAGNIAAFARRADQAYDVIGYLRRDGHLRQRGAVALGDPVGHVLGDQAKRDGRQDQQGGQPV